jgi:benzoate/toluate 1,2-dioxygenase beta subunit
MNAPQASAKNASEATSEVNASDTAPAVPITEAERREVEDFLYLEARLADESRYTEWEALAEGDMFYWISRGDGDFDRNREVSITADNRSRLANRIKQLNTGVRHAQVPPSPMRRMVSNVEITRMAEPSGPSRDTHVPNEPDVPTGADTRCLHVACNFVLYELRIQSTHAMQVWPGRMEFHLRRRPQGFGMFYKRVMLVNGNEPLPSIAFIL